MAMLRAAWQWVHRCGVDATFLAVAAAHVAWILTVAAILRTELLPHSLTEDLGMLGIGGVATSAALLAVWMAAGPGRFAVRSLWAVVLVEGTWLAVTVVLPDGNGSDSILFRLTGMTALPASALAFLTAMGFWLMRGWRLVIANAAPAPGESRWQFRLADLLLAMVTAALLLVARQRFADVSIVLYRMDGGLDGSILYAVRCAAALCVVVALGGIWLLLRERARIAWTIALAILSALGVMLLNVLPLASPLFSDWTTTARIFADIGLGSLVVTLGTLLPVRWRKWRVARIVGGV